MVLMEAVQMGVPVVAMDSFGSLHDIIEDGVNGSIVPNNDMSAFVAAMKQMMQNEELRHEMSSHAVERSKSFVIDEVVRRWKQVFSELIQEKQ